MLLYVQMKWNYQSRISQEKLWEMVLLEARQGIKSGALKGLYKVVAQHRVIAIIDADSLEALDGDFMGRLPMREFLEVEHVWPLREYEGFIEDVTNRFTTSQPLSAMRTEHFART